MLHITDNAATWMRSALAGEDGNDNQCFRIIVTGRGLQLMRGEERPDDVAAYTHEGKAVLVLDGATAEFLKDLAVDYDADTSELVIDDGLENAADFGRAAALSGVRAGC
jgi:Fe-S cluster assembly iron-binding protein IscA